MENIIIRNEPDRVALISESSGAEELANAERSLTEAQRRAS